MATQYVSKINGYVIKDAEAHKRIDEIESTGGGKINNVQVNGESLTIDSDKAVNLEVDGDYSSSNKVATVQTVTEKVDAAVQSIMGDDVNDAYDTFKEMQEYIETHGTAAGEMANNITQNTKDIGALEETVENLGLTVNYDETKETLALSLGKGGTTSSGGSGTTDFLTKSEAESTYAKIKYRHILSWGGATIEWIDNGSYHSLDPKTDLRIHLRDNQHISADTAYPAFGVMTMLDANGVATKYLANGIYCPTGGAWFYLVGYKIQNTISENAEEVMITSYTTAKYLTDAIPV